MLQPDDPAKRLLIEALLVSIEAAERARHETAAQAEQEQLEQLQRMFPSVRSRG